MINSSYRYGITTGYNNMYHNINHTIDLHVIISLHLMD